MADFPPMSVFASAFAAEYKGFMRAAGVTGTQLAAKLGRNEGYVSERVNGKRAVDTNDIDALAELAGHEWNGKTLMAELARRVRASEPRDNITPIFAASTAAAREEEWTRPLVANESIDETRDEHDSDFDNA